MAYIPLAAQRLAEVLLDEPNLSPGVRVELDRLLIVMKHPLAPPQRKEKDDEPAART